jgi:hypothetical protein
MTPLHYRSGKPTLAGLAIGLVLTSIPTLALIGAAVLLLALAGCAQATTPADVRPYRAILAAPVVAPNATATATPEPERCEATGKVNVRACGGMTCAITGWLEAGQVVTVVERGEWLRISGPDGYIWAALCEALP